MKTQISFVIVLSLSACGGLPTPVATLPPAQVASIAQDLNSTRLTPGEYVNAGMLGNDWNCDAYLMGEAQLNGNFGIAAQTGSLATAVTTGLLGVTGAGAPAIATAGIAGGGLVSGLGILQQNTGIPYSAATAEKVKEAMAAFAEAVWQNPPPTLEHAGMLVEKHRWLCTPPGITWLANMSIASAQVSASAPSLTTNAAGVLTRRFSLPTVSVNGLH